MPELPEVETVRRGLAPALEGRILRRVTLRRAGLRIPFPEGFSDRLTGQRVSRLGRRAKYLLLMMEAGDVVIVHLGMSGRFSVQGREVGSFVHEVPAEGQGTGKHDHVVFETDEGTLLVYSDHRRFGLMTLSTESGLDAHPLFAGLGPEPLTPKFGATYLLTAISGKRMPIKPALLDQRIVAGLGNIYVCEALFDSHISPLRPASSLSRDECVALVSSIKSVLKAAIKAGGSTLRDFRHADGELGYFQHSFSVYGREGEKCISPGCAGTVERTLQSGRSTFHCPVCQR